MLDEYEKVDKKVDKGVSRTLGVAVVVIGGKHRTFYNILRCFKTRSRTRRRGKTRYFGNLQVEVHC